MVASCQREVCRAEVWCSRDVGRDPRWQVWAVLPGGTQQKRRKVGTSEIGCDDLGAQMAGLQLNTTLAP